GVDIVGREEIRCAVWAVEHADAPFMGETRLPSGGEGDRLARVRRHLADMQHVARLERAPTMAAEFAERKGGAAAEIFGNIDAAAHGDIGAHSWSRHIAELQHLPSPDSGSAPI